MSSFWNKSWYEVIRDYSPYSGKSKFLFFAGLLAVMYLAFQVFPQESAFRTARREGATNPQLLSSFAIQYPDSYRIGTVDDLLWEAASGPQGNCALYLYRRTFPYGRHQSEAKQRPATDERSCGKPQTVYIGRIRGRRIALSVSEGTLLPEPRPLADAQGYPEYALEHRRGAQREK